MTRRRTWTVQETLRWSNDDYRDRGQVGGPAFGDERIEGPDRWNATTGTHKEAALSRFELEELSNKSVQGGSGRLCGGWMTIFEGES